MQTDADSMENNMEIPLKKKKTKLGIKLSYKPVIPLLSIEKYTCTPVFITALFTIARTWKKPRFPSIDKWIRKL